MLRTPNQVSLSLTVKQKLVLTLLVAVLSTTPFWLASEHVHSASPEFASSPAGAPVPEVKLADVPAEALIGEPFTFKVTFDNIGNAVGYAPFIDVVLPAHGISGPVGGPCDGISMPAGQSAMMVAVNGGPLPVKTYQSLTTPCGPAPGLVTHPYSASGVSPVLVPPGGQLLTLELPFGSFEPDQPKIEVEITVDLHNYANVGQKLTIYARGGFRYGTTALNEAGDPPILTNAGNPLTDGWDKKDVTPTVFIVSKTYLGPEGEAVSGPNFVGYYPLQYQVTVNIANGQKVTNLNIDDCLENNMSFVGLVSGQTTAGSTSSFTSPCLHLSYGTVTGTGSPADLVVTYEFYITQFVSGTKTPVLDPEICANATSTNKVVASGDWVPLDPRDTAATVTGSAKYTLTDKRLAIQKSVKVKTVGKKGQLLDKNDLPIPGDYLEYRLRFQVSDYFTFGELEINDLLSDGQLFTQAAPAGPATIRVTDLFGTSQGQFGKSSLDVQEYFEENCQGVKGGTRLTFKVSQAMMSLSSFPRHNQGIMTGGHAFTPITNVPAEGEIVFYVQIQDEFSHQGNDKKKYVDKHDPMNNCVTISGRIYRNSDDKQPKPLENKDAVCSDDSATSLMIKPDVLQKSIIARNGKTLKPSPKAPPKFGAGDTITFRITKTIPSGDWEDLKVQDWAPLPALDTTTLTIPNPIPSCGGVFPAAGQVCLGPTDNVGQPMATSLNPDNSFTLDYGTQNNPANTPKTIEIWVSLKLTNKPYADGLFFTNEAQECEFNTFGVKFCQVAVARFELTEPSLRITKGVVWAGSGETPVVKNSSAVFTPSPPAPAGVIFAAPPSCKSFSGTIKSSGLNNTPISSDVSNVDASDTVLFAIVVENLGSGLNGAFDVRVRDALPAGLTVVSPVCITYGDGVPIATDNANPTADLFTPGGITLADPSAMQGALDPLNSTSAANGHNLAVITFYAQISPEIHPSCYTNRAELRDYASTEGGPSFVKPAGFGGPFSDTANVCILPQADKCVTATSEPHTQPGNSLDAAPPQPPKVAIGEIVRYRLQVKVPEGVSTAFTITDILPPSMTYMNDNTTKVLFISDKGLASDVPAIANLDGLHAKGPKVNCYGPKPVATLPLSQITPGSFSPGVAPSFKLGTITNSDYDAPAEYVILEFNALVNNLPPNVSALPNRDGVTLSNTFKVLIKGAPSPAATSNPADVKIVEPKLDVVKTASPTSALPGALITFNVNVTNTGTADAFDVLITDTLPAASGLSVVTGTSAVASTCSTPTLNTTTGAVSVPRIPVGCGVTLTFKARVIANCPTASVTNTAKVAYTSLPLNGTPLGPNNLTGSITPGASGASNGERKYTASGSVTVPLLCTGSLTVTKTIKSSPPFTPPASTVFPVTVSCSPSGPNVTLNLTAAAPTQTVNNIPVGSTCTVTEGALPPPIAHPACASLGWGTPTYSPAQSVVIPTAGSNVTVEVQNTYGCKTGCATPPAGMVAWWSLDETSGNVVHSIVGNHDGTTQPGAIGTSLSVATAPKVGSALFFGATRAEVPDDPALDFGTGNFSIDAWVRSHQSTLLSAVVDKLDTTTPARRGYAFFVQNGKAQLVMADGVNIQTFQSSSTFAADGTWRHVAVTVRRVGGTPVGQFYIDGAPAGPSFTPLMGNIDSNATLLIANHRLSANACSCEVSLDEIELFKTAVAAGDIKKIFAAGSAGKCRATIGGMKFDDLNGNGLKDTGEPGLANWTIKATDSGGNPQLTTTNSLGNYSFTVPAPGSYTLAEVLQTGWTQTAPATGTYAVAVTPNQAVNNRDFGNRKQQALCDLSIRKEVKPTPLVSGQPGTFTVTVKNVGTLPCHGPTLVTESMPAGLTLGSASVSGGSCVLSSGACTYPPGIPVNGTVMFTYVFKVTAQPGASFENCVGLQNAEDKNPANNGTCIPLTVGGTGAPNTLTAKNARGGSLPGLLLGACD